MRVRKYYDVQGICGSAKRWARHSVELCAELYAEHCIQLGIQLRIDHCIEHCHHIPPRLPAFAGGPAGCGFDGHHRHARRIPDRA